MKKSNRQVNFRPRVSRVKSWSVRLGWRDSLTGWSGLYWGLQPENSGRLDDSQRFANLKLARKLIKKKGHLEIANHPGLFLTSKSAGVRMGNGKGKTVGRRQWLLPGQPWLRLTTSLDSARKIQSRLAKRVGASIRLVSSSF